MESLVYACNVLRIKLDVINEKKKRIFYALWNGLLVMTIKFSFELVEMLKTNMCPRKGPEKDFIHQVAGKNVCFIFRTMKKKQ